MAFNLLKKGWLDQIRRWNEARTRSSRNRVSRRAKNEKRAQSANSFARRKSWKARIWNRESKESQKWRADTISKWGRSCTKKIGTSEIDGNLDLTSAGKVPEKLSTRIIPPFLSPNFVPKDSKLEFPTRIVILISSLKRRSPIRKWRSKTEKLSFKKFWSWINEKTRSWRISSKRSKT